MDDGSIYRAFDPNRLCQGDIIANLAHVVHRPPLRALRPFSAKGGKQAFSPHVYDVHRTPATQLDVPKGGFRFQSPEGELGVASVQMTLGMVISHGCDVDKRDSKNWLIAMIRRLAVLSEDDWPAIRDGTQKRAFYLPAYGDHIPEGYVDFRRITCIQKQPLEELNRIVGLTDEAVEDLHWHMFRFITRREIAEGIDLDQVAPVSQEDPGE